MIHACDYYERVLLAATAVERGGAGQGRLDSRPMVALVVAQANTHIGGREWFVESRYFFWNVWSFDCSSRVTDRINDFSSLLFTFIILD